MSKEERFELIAEIANLPNADKQFVLGCAVGLMAKMNKSPEPTKRREEKEEKQSA